MGFVANDVRAAILLALILPGMVAACEPDGGAPEATPTLSESPELTPGDGLVFPVQETASGMESRLDGKLVQRQQCLLIRAPRSRDLYLPFWPPNATYEDRGDSVVVLIDGVVSARTGTPISVGGGTAGASRPASLKEAASGCPGTYWIVSVINRG